MFLGACSVGMRLDSKPALKFYRIEFPYTCRKSKYHFSHWNPEPSICIILPKFTCLDTLVIIGLCYLSRYSDMRQAGWSGDRIPVKAKFPAQAQTSPGSTQPPIKWVNRLEHGPDHTPPCSAEIKRRVEMSLYLVCGPSWLVLSRTILFSSHKWWTRLHPRGSLQDFVLTKKIRIKNMGYINFRTWTSDGLQ